jgi:hypothetical protein
MTSVSMGVAILCLFAPMGITLLIWILYNFHLESKRSAQHRKHTRAIVRTASLGSTSGLNSKSLIIVVALTLISMSAVGQPASASRAPQSGQTDALQKKVEGLEQGLQEVKAELDALRASEPGATVPTPSPATSQTAQLPTATVESKETKPSILPASSTLNFTLDGYYGYNLNHPPGRVNSLRAYDVLSNSFSLNQAAVIFELPTDPANGRRFGARLDLQFGQATATLQGNPANENRPDIYRNIFQAYGRYDAPIGKGLTIDFGKWASSLGFEGNYTKDQLNYTRSFFFYYLPFYHMGIRTNYQFNDKIAFNYWLVNGTQQTEPFNSFKDEMFAFTVTPTHSITWNINYYLGQEHPDVTPSTNCGSAPLQPGLCFSPIAQPPNGKTHIFDSYMNWQVKPKLLLGVEGDYVIQRLWANAAPGESSAPSHVDGGAAYLQYQFTPRVSFAARTEYLSDRGGLFSGTTQALKEGTGTTTYRFGDGFIGMLEYRRDWTNQLFFPRGTAGALVGHQDTATLGLVWWYGGKQGSW